MPDTVASRKRQIAVFDACSQKSDTSDVDVPL
jgi:hypothetical protein